MRTRLTLGAATLLLAACGGGNPLDNPPDVDNPATSGTGGSHLSFDYFQKCVDPVLQRPVTSSAGTSTCASTGCHDSVAGTGGALRVVRSAAQMPLLGADAATLRASDMYKNFYSSQGVSVIGAPAQSRLLNKPLVIGVLHGGGLIFDSDQAAEVQRLRYWITRPVPAGRDEFFPTEGTMYTQTDPSDPATLVCRTE